jgi:tetratricopeptide (TPR) repeat protein
MLDLHTVLADGVPGEIAAALGVLAGVLAVIGGVIGIRGARLGWRTALATATPSPPPSRPRSQLPTPPRLVNRTDEVRDALLRLDAGEAVLTIEGDIGIGKSTVANAVAHRLRQAGERAGGTPGEDGRTFLWIDCGYRCPSMVDICRPLSLLTGDQALTTVPDYEKLDALRAHLAKHESVLVLDDMALADDADSRALRALVRTVPAGSTVITSIDRPGELAGAHLLVETLEFDHVKQLILQEVRDLGLRSPGDFDDAFAKRLQGLVGGNPRMIQRFLQTLKYRSQSIEERFEAVERGEDMPELFMPRWAELSQDSQLALSACAYLRGQAIRDQLAIACELADDDVSPYLDELVAAGLIATVRVSGRPDLYTCAPGLRRFVLAQTTESTLQGFTRRLVRHYIDYFGDNWEDAPAAIPHMAAVQVLLEELSAIDDDRDLQRLLAVTLDIYFTLGLFDDRISAGTLAYHSAMRAENYCAASLASAMVANTHAIRGEIERAREALALGLVAAQRSQAPREIARQMRCNGFVSYRAGEPKQALDAIEGADTLARDAGDLNNVVDILGLRTAAHWYLGSTTDAERAARSCLELCEEIGWKRGVAYPLRDLAEIAVHAGEYRAAQTLLDRARDACEQYGDRRQMARLSLTQARMCLLSGRLTAAARVAQAAETQAMEVGLPPEQREARSLRLAARRARVVPPLRLYYAWRRPTRLTDAPVGGD